MKGKASQEFWSIWRRNPFRFSDPKEVYDQLLSLEAKIEVLEEMIKAYERPKISADLPEWTTNIMFLKNQFLKEEYNELIKTHKLTQTEI